MGLRMRRGALDRSLGLASLGKPVLEAESRFRWAGSVYDNGAVDEGWALQ
jgi:hypothetical protein